MNLTRVFWGALGLALLVFSIFQSVTYGWAAGAVIIVFAILPDIALIGAFAEQGLLRPSRVRFYNLLHTPWIPLVVIAVSFLPWPSLGWGLRGGHEIFLAGVAWLMHIAVDRALGYGRREADGSIRPVGAQKVQA